MSEKAAPAMFEGARVRSTPPSDTATDKSTDRATALKANDSGAPAVRVAGFALLPVVAVGLLALAAWSPMAALIAGGALVVAVLVGIVSRARGKRQVATRTSVRPDGTVTTTTKPVARRERSRRQRTQNGPSGRRPRGDGGSSDSRNRSWIPGSDRRNNRRSTPHGGPGSPGGRLGGSGPGNPPGKSPRMRERMWPGKAKHDVARNQQSPGGGSKNPNTRGPKSPSSDGTDGRWPWSRNRNSGGSPSGKTPGRAPRSPRSKRPRGDSGNPGSSSGGGGGRPWRDKSNSGGNSGGQPKVKSPRNVKHSAPSAPNGGKSSKVPNWVKRAVVPANSPSHDRSAGVTKRVKEKARDKWHDAWGDNTPVVKPKRRSAKSDTSSDSSESRRRNWWPTRGGGNSDDSGGSGRNSESRYRRLTQRLNRPTKVARPDFAARLDERLKARGVNRYPDDFDPIARWGRDRRRSRSTGDSSVEAAAFAEDWTPTPTNRGVDRASAESGLVAEDDWAPSKPSRPAPRSASKGGNSTMSNESSESTAAAGTSRAYEAAQRDARTGSLLATATANKLRADAARLPDTPRMAPHKTALGVQAGKWARVSAVYSAIASKLGQSAAQHQGGERLQ
jgi:hypothetical protein